MVTDIKEKFEKYDEYETDWSEFIKELIASIPNRFVAGYLCARLDMCNDETEEKKLIAQICEGNWAETFWTTQ